jgi:transposase
MARPSRYREEFRREAVQLALASDTSWASVARRLGVNETTLRNWCLLIWLRRPGRLTAHGEPAGVRGVAPAAGGERRVEGGEGDPA